MYYQIIPCIDPFQNYPEITKLWGWLPQQPPTRMFLYPVPQEVLTKGERNAEWKDSALMRASEMQLWTLLLDGNIVSPS